MIALAPVHAPIAAFDDPILVTGATGFIGSRVVEQLLDRGFRHLRCLARRPGSLPAAIVSAARRTGARVDILEGNLLSRADCRAAAAGARVIYHLAAARGEKSVPDAFMNSVVTTRNLLDAALADGALRRFVNVSSFTVYAGAGPRARVLDESARLEDRPALRGDAYSYAKVKQEELVADYARRFGLSHVVIRPGYVYGPGNEPIPGRVGVGTFGIFLHLGGPNPLPLTYVDNCAAAIVLAGVTPGIDGEAFNVVDDGVPSSRQFLRLYKRNVRRFRSIYLPHAVSYSLCWLWESYSNWSQGQLPPTFNRRSWQAYWGRRRYSNEKLKSRLGWAPLVPTTEALQRYFESCRYKLAHA